MLTQARSTAPADAHRLADASINYDLFKLRARQLQKAFVAKTVAEARRGLLRAFKMAIGMIRQTIEGRPVAHQQRR